MKNIEPWADNYVGCKHTARPAELTKLCNIAFGEKCYKRL